MSEETKIKKEADHNKYWLQTFGRIANDGNWESNYDKNSFITYNFLSRRESVKQLLDGDSYESVLDLGCGTGEYVVMLSEFTNNYVGLDYSASMIARAKNKYKDLKLLPEFTCGSGEVIPFDDDKFDMICAIGYIQYFINPSKTLNEIRRVLKPGGTLIIQTYQNHPFNFFLLKKIRGFLRLVYNKIKQKECLKYSNNSYTKKEIDNLLFDYGFEIKQYNYSNFIIIPLSRCFPGIYIKISEMIHAKYPTKFKRFAVNYNAKYVLNK